MHHPSTVICTCDDNRPSAPCPVHTVNLRRRSPDEVNAYFGEKVVGMGTEIATLQDHLRQLTQAIGRHGGVTIPDEAAANGLGVAMAMNLLHRMMDDRADVETLRRELECARSVAMANEAQANLAHANAELATHRQWNAETRLREGHVALDAQQVPRTVDGHPLTLYGRIGELVKMKLAERDDFWGRGHAAGTAAAKGAQ